MTSGTTTWSASIGLLAAMAWLCSSSIRWPAASSAWRRASSWRRARRAASLACREENEILHFLTFRRPLSVMRVYQLISILLSPVTPRKLTRFNQSPFYFLLSVYAFLALTTLLKYSRTSKSKRPPKMPTFGHQLREFQLESLDWKNKKSEWAKELFNNERFVVTFVSASDLSLRCSRVSCRASLSFLNWSIICCCRTASRLSLVTC